MNDDTTRRRRRPRLPSRLVAVSWRDLLVIFVPVLVLATLMAWLAVKFLNPAPPGTIRMLSGPDGSSYRTTAEKYKKIIETHGVKVEILPSSGGLDNLKRLADPTFKVDVGLVPGGLTDGVNISRLVSLGSLTPQPLIVFYRNPEPVERLAQFAGKRLAIGPEGSGTRALALKLLAANGVDKSNTTLLDLAGEEAAHALVDQSIDAAFLMGDSATPAVMRGLRKTPGIELMNFRQANGYVRRFRFLSRLTLPEGSIDLGEDYRWRVRSRIYRWYGALMAIERDMLLEHTPEERQQILKRLDRIDDSVNRLKTPLSFADQLYVLRQHISWVQHRLQPGSAPGTGEPHTGPAGR